MLSLDKILRRAMSDSGLSANELARRMEISQPHSDQVLARGRYEVVERRQDRGGAGAHAQERLEP